MAYAYIRHIPSPPLNAYVEFLYYQESRLYPREKKYPMPNVHMLINFGGTIQVHDAYRAEPFATIDECSVIGTWDKCHVITWPLNIQIFGVCFKPGAAYSFMKFPLSEVRNQFVSLDAIWGDFASEMRERLDAPPTIQARFALLEQLLLARLGEAPHGLDIVRYSVAEIARQHGVLSIRALSDAIGISQKHLITQFKRMVGVSPKELAGLLRLKHVFSMINPAQPVDWGLLAQQAGYYDQAHFNKDFKAFLGHSPTDYLRLRRQLYAKFPEQDLYLRTLPIG